MARQRFRFTRVASSAIIINFNGSQTDDLIDPRLLADPGLTAFLSQLQLSTVNFSLNVRQVGTLLGVSLSKAWRDDGTITLSNVTAGDLVLDYTASRTSSPYRFTLDAAAQAWYSAYRGASDQTLDFTIDDGVPAAAIEELSVGRPYAYPRLFPVGIEAATGRPHAFAHAESVQTDMAVGRPVAQVKRAVLPITQEQAVGRPHGQRLTYAEPFPAFLTWELGARNRTRGGGATWEWNDDDVALPPPFGDHLDAEKDRTRVAADQIRITDPDNDNLGFTERFATTGSMTLWSPSDPGVGAITFEHPVFAANGRFDPTGHPDWAAWWTAFSADAAHELSIRFDIPGPEIEHDVGRPVGVLDRTKYGLPEPLAVEQDIGRAAAIVFGHGSPVVAEQSVGRARGYIPKIAAQPIAQELSTGRPHAFAHAEFVLQEQAVGQPVAGVKRAVLPIAQEQMVGRPAANIYGVPGSTTAGATTTESRDLGARDLVRPDANSTWQWNTNLTLPEPIMTATAGPIAQVHVRANQVRFIRTGGQNPGFSDAFNTSGRLILSRVGGSSFTIVGPNFDHLGRMDPSGLDGYSTWWNEFSVIGGAASELAITWELETTGFQPFLALEQAVGRPEGRTQVVAEPMPIAQELSLTRPHAFAHAEFILQEFAVGRPGVSTSRGARPIALEQSAGRPHAFAHAESILQDLAVSRPRGFIPAVAAQLIEQTLSVGRPDGVKRRFAVGMPIAAEQAVGRPRGFIPKVAAQPIAMAAGVSRPVARVKRAVQPIVQEQAVGRPQPYAHGAGVVEEQAVGRPRGYLPKVAAYPIALEQSVSRPHAFAHAEFILLEQAVGRPRGQTSRGVRPVVQELAVSRPHTLREVEAIAQELAVGRPRGFIPKIAAQAIAQEQVVGRPTGVTQTRAQPAVIEQAVGRPIARVKRAVLPIAIEQAVGRPHRVAHASTIAVEQAVGRPVVVVKRAVMPIAAEQAVGMPAGERRRIGYGREIAAELAVGRPVAEVKRAVLPIVLEQMPGRPTAVLLAGARPLELETGVGRPNGRILRVGTFPIAGALDVSRPHGERVRTTPTVPVLVELAVGRPRYYRQAFGTELAVALETGAPRGFFPRRNPLREAAADVQAHEADFSVAANGAEWQATAR